jgi:RNA-directed DNA polymerase
MARLDERRPGMRRAGNLWPRIASFEALHAAYLRARKGKRFTPEVLAFEADREGNLARLLQGLESGTYRPGTYRTFTVRDPKPRLVSAAPFRDRVVHHALVAAVEPVFEPTFVFDSYANRKHKGTHAALGRYRAWCATYRYVLRCDVAKFFPSVDHGVLKTLLAHKVKDARTLGLCDLVIRSWPPAGMGEPGRGLPIGNLTSQFFQNVYLDQLDHFVKETLGCRAYLRYVDDFCLLANDSRLLRGWRERVRDRLADLRLAPNARTFEVSPTDDGVNWVGYFVTPHDCIVRRKARIRSRRGLRRRWEGLRAGRIAPSDLTASVRSWIAHASHGRSVALRRHLLSRFPPWAGGGR